ncbi:hypothetical protein KAU19_04305 [Candidatus Parcubacteria bacterium]|nr:hypothetical protein [Candidatus Parcubacteria bacterium]
MLTYLQLRKLLKEFPKYPNTKFFNKALVVNKAFPSHFNLSFSEPEQIEIFGNLIDVSEPLIYSKIQPVIRTNDFKHHILLNTKDSYKYLALFDLGDIGGAIFYPNQDNLKKFHEHSIISLWKFLIEKLRFNPNKLYISCFAGGKVDKITKGKYRFDRYIEQDKFSINVWKKLGLCDSNIILDHTRDTFLALNILQKSTPWGYRNEIFYNISKDNCSKNLLDIGTMEYFIWEPIFQNREIDNIKSWKFCAVLHGIGLERILMAKNSFNDIIECDHIFPLYELILKNSKNRNQHQARILTESLSVTHRVLKDCNGWESLSHRHKYQLKIYMKAIYESMNELNIDITESKLEEFFKLNARLQGCYPELSKNISVVIDDVFNYFKRKY